MDNRQTNAIKPVPQNTAAASCVNLSPGHLDGHLTLCSSAYALPAGTLEQCYLRYCGWTACTDTCERARGDKLELGQRVSGCVANDLAIRAGIYQHDSVLEQRYPWHRHRNCCLNFLRRKHSTPLRSEN